MKQNFSAKIAKHLREACFGENWTDVNLKDTLTGITWKMASAKIDSINTIASLVYHMNYYVKAAIPVLEEGKLDAKDKSSFDHPPINSEEDWNNLKGQVFADVEHLVKLLEQMPEEKLNDIFVEEKYGDYFRNIAGTIEHFYYHLGQIVLIKKLAK